VAKRASCVRGLAPAGVNLLRWHQQRLSRGKHLSFSPRDCLTLTPTQRVAPQATRCGQYRMGDPPLTHTLHTPGHIPPRRPPESHLTLPADNAAILNTTISEGNDLSIQFSLGFTLICPENDPNCRVLILLDNQRPDELVLSVRDSVRQSDSF
jgi:hypothetical protein